MMPNISKFLTLVLLVILSASVAGMGQGGPNSGSQNQPARGEINAYFQANVLPVLRRQRQKLEPQLEAADRAQLATYRTQLAALKAQGQALRHSIAPAATPAGGRPTLTDAQKQQVQQLRSQTRTIMVSVAQMAQKYEAPIRQLAQEVQPQKEKWAADIKALMSKNATPEQQQRMAEHGERGPGGGGMHRFFKPAMFLLMDPNAPATNDADFGSTGSSFYPNPAAATSQLNFDVKQAGPVTVELLDANGNKLRTLVSEANMEKGAHTQQLNLGDLPAGTYFYKVTTKSGSETKRFVKE